jgi:WD40 repeat protein/tetratricopeptide (TPR) repeat protein
VPRDLETIIATATARDPAARYVTAAALAEDLQRFVEDRPIRARRVSAVERLARWCRRNKGLAAAIGLAALTLVAAVISSLLYAREQRGLAAARKLYAAEQAHRADDQAAAAASYKAALSESNRRLATLNLERGRAAFEKGQIGVGMLWTVEALRMATEAGDPAWRGVALANLSAWRRQLVELKGVFSPGGMISAVAFSPDGKTILIGSGDHPRLWDVATGRPLGPPLKHPVELSSVAFSPDGRMIVTGTFDGNAARRWDFASRQPMGEPLEHSGPVLSVAFSPDGRTILTGCADGTAWLWDAHNGRPIATFLMHRGAVYSAVFSPDGRTILTASQDRTARLWDVTGQPVGPPMVHPDQVRAAAFSPDGRTILTGGYDKAARLWQAATGQLIGTLPEHPDRVRAATFSPDGRTILTGGYDKTARLWDAATGQSLGPPLEHSDRVLTVAFSPDSRTILAGGLDGTVRAWEVGTGRPVGGPLDHGSYGRATALRFTNDGASLIALGLDGKVRRWDLASGHLLGQPVDQGTFQIDTVASSPDGKTILNGIGDQTARLRDAATGRPLGPPLTHPGVLASVALSPDGKTVVTGCQDWMARLWDARTGQPIGPPMPHSFWVQAVAFHPDGRTILTSDRQTAWRWNVPAPLPDDLPRLWAWVEAATGMELNESGSVRALDRDAWLERRSRLESLGGPPPPDPSPRGDPILFGPDPAARGDALAARGLWDRAEAAYADAIRDRPLHRPLRDALARLHAQCGRLDRATAALAEAIRLLPDDTELRRALGLSLLSSGDRAGWRRSTAATLDRLGGTTDLVTANSVARACVLGTEAAAEPGVPVRLAELAVRCASADYNKPDFLNTLGAALYRAGRYDEAICRQEEAIRLRGGASRPEDWPFLSMAHHRMGHRDLARRWLDLLRGHQPSNAPGQFWNELEIRLLRSEAEAVILCDSTFPDDPFAR